MIKNCVSIDDCLIVVDICSRFVVGGGMNAGNALYVVIPVLYACFEG